MSVTGVSYVAGVFFLWLPVAVPGMWVVVSVPGMCFSVPEMCCLGRNVVSLWVWTYNRIPIVLTFGHMQHGIHMFMHHILSILATREQDNLLFGMH
jgi:hypothetical protein